jgi:hypothetical protein
VELRRHPADLARHRGHAGRLAPAGTCGRTWLSHARAAKTPAQAVFGGSSRRLAKYASTCSSVSAIRVRPALPAAAQHSVAQAGVAPDEFRDLPRGQPRERVDESEFVLCAGRRAPHSASADRLNHARSRPVFRVEPGKRPRIRENAQAGGRGWLAALGPRICPAASLARTPSRASPTTATSTSAPVGELAEL